MRAALVGLGYWGKTIVPTLKSLETELDFTLVHVCDHHQENIDEVRADFPKLEPHLEFDALLAAEDFELVFLATRPESHHELVKKSLMRGCHVFLEKPFVYNPDQARELRDLAAARARVLMVGHRLVYSPAVVWVRENLFSVPEPRGVSIEASWKDWGAHMPGGVHWDLACHYLAVLNFLTGHTPEVLSAHSLARSASGNHMRVSIVLRYYGDLLATLDVSWLHPLKKKELVVRTPEQVVLVDHEADVPLRSYRAVVGEHLDVHFINTLPVLVASRHSRESGNPGDERHGDWMPAYAGMTFYWRQTYETDI